MAPPTLADRGLNFDDAALAAMVNLPYRDEHHQCEEAREKLERHLKASGICLKFDTPPPTATPPPEPPK
jgi:hypothetical protein